MDHLGGKVRPWMKPSLFILFFVSIAAISFSISGEDLWRCPVCDTHPRPAAIASSPTNISHIVFGIAGSVDTWHKRRRYSELWWRPETMRGHVWLEEPPHDPWPRTCPPYQVSSRNTSRFGARAAASRIARIAAEAYEAAGKDDADGDGVRWFVMGDDDTVFFPENLVAVLGKYDHREMWYIGAASESVEQDVMHSYDMAFGGGGFAVSHPAALALAGAIDGCLDRYAYFYGSDQRVHACFMELGVPLTREPGFHQVDLRGDAYGMLAAHPVAPVVSLHHLDYVKPISPRHASQIDSLLSLVGAARADPARTLQQAVCYVREPDRKISWSVSVSWGYTVQLYPWVLAPKDLVVPLRTFQTWRSWGEGPFTFNTRPLPGPDRPCDRPLVYFLNRVKVGKNRPGGFTTVTNYLRYVEKGNPQCNRTGFKAALKIQSVRVSAPRMDPHVWRRAPRRQCCEARRVVGWFTTRMEVKIRDCFPGEITAPL